MVDNSNSREYLDNDNEAVIEHMRMYQGIITRMANNSAACKKWCIPLVTAILAFVVKEKLINLVWLTLIPILIFYFLDVYYLKLENQFRESFNSSAKNIQQGVFSPESLFSIHPEGLEKEFWLKAIVSFSTWPVYLGLFSLLVFAYKQL